MTSSDTTSESANSLDRLVQAWQARFTGGLSPASMLLAYFDWLVHLGSTPGKQAHLLEDAWQGALQLAAYTAQSADSHAPPPVEPRPQDQRFTDAAWQSWPFNVISQSFLLAEQWWQSATVGIPGVSRHHEDVVSFGARQWLEHAGSI